MLGACNSKKRRASRQLLSRITVRLTGTFGLANSDVAVLLAVSLQKHGPMHTQEGRADSPAMPTILRTSSSAANVPACIQHRWQAFTEGRVQGCIRVLRGMAQSQTA